MIRRTTYSVCVLSKIELIQWKEQGLESKGLKQVALFKKFENSKLFRNSKLGENVGLWQIKSFSTLYFNGSDVSLIETEALVVYIV